MNQNTRNIMYLFVSRSFRSFAAGFLAVIVSLYFYDVLNFSLILVGALFTAGAFATPFISLAGGVLGDKYGRKVVMIIDLLTLPLSIAILLLTKNIIALGLASALGGFGVSGGLVGGGVGGSVAPITNALLAENTNKKNRTTIYSVNSMISTFSGAAGAVLVSFIGFIPLFWIGLFISVLSVLVILPLKEKYRVNENHEIKSDQNQNSQNLKFIKAFAYTGLLSGIAQGLITPYYPIIFHSFFHMSTGLIGYLFSLGGILTGIIYIFTPSLTKKLGFLKFITRTRFISSTLLFFIPFSPNYIIASIIYLVITPVRAISLPAQSALMMTLIHEERRATSSGINQATRLIGSAFATLAGGTLLALGPFSIPFIIAVGINYGNIDLYYYFFRGIPEAERSKS